MMSSAWQLKDKIRNLAREKSADAQMLLRSYMMERLLERIAVSRYHNTFILKGGMLVAAMVGIEARSTMDIDTTVSGATVSAEELRTILEEIISVDVSDGVQFTINRLSDIMDEAEYPGIRVGMTAYMDGVKVALKIDISTGDIITPRAVEYPYKLMFEDRSIRLLAYNLETVLAEKLETIISRTTTNTRMRDFYDICILSQLYAAEIDPKVLSAALNATAQKRGSLGLLADAEKVLTALHTSNNMEVLWNRYRSKYSYAANLSWSAILQSVQDLAAAAGLQIERPSL